VTKQYDCGELRSAINSFSRLFSFLKLLHLAGLLARTTKLIGPRPFGGPGEANGGRGQVVEGPDTTYCQHDLCVPRSLGQ